MARYAVVIAVLSARVAPPARAQRPDTPGAVQRGPLPASSLAVWMNGGWRTWWRSEGAPTRWRTPDGPLAAVRWTRANPGVELAEVRLAGSGEAWRTRVVLVRLDPAHVRFALQERTVDGASRGGWTIDSAPPSALVALNAGQFVGGSPWGWVVTGGVERYSMGSGPLSTAIVVGRDGAVRLATPDSVAARRASVLVAFQSYPTLLVGDGEVPSELRAAGGGVDVGHRDARLALGVDRAGRVVIALTRFDALGGALSSVPFGLTTPEMSALMGALGCSRAVALDGGISAQLRVRDASGATHEWHGLRAVPLGLIVERR